MEINSLWAMVNNNDRRAHFTKTGTIKERLSSGLRINRGADDPHGIAISSNLRATIGGLNTAIQNTQDALSMIQTAEGGMKEIHSLLQRGRDLAVRASNEATLSSSDIQDMQDEVDSILAEIDRLSETVTFNSKQLLSGATGQQYTFDSQADWASANAVYDSSLIDLNSAPGNVQLAYQDWNTQAHWNNPIGDINDDTMDIWVDGSAPGSGYDPTTGKYTARLYIGGETVGGTGQLKGTLTFEAGANLSNASNCVIAGNTITFDRTATNSFSTLASVDIEVDVGSKWDLQLTNRNNEPVAMYFGSTLLGDTRPAVFYSQYFTDIAANPASYYTAPIDTRTSGGQAVLNYNSIITGGQGAQIVLYESATGNPAFPGDWTALPITDNGATFDYNQRYLRAEITLNSNGVQYGTPAVTDLSLQLSDPGSIQIGSDNGDNWRDNLSALNLHANALGLSNLKLTDRTGAALLIDTQQEWMSSLNNMVDVDPSGNPGYLQLGTDVKTTSSPDKANTHSIVISVNTANPQTDGSIDYTVSVRYWGGGALGSVIWQSYFSVFDGSGAVTIDEITTLSTDWTGDQGDSVGEPALSAGLSGYRDGVYGVTGSRTNYDSIPNSDITQAGAYEEVYCDMATGGQMDGFTIKFNAQPDASFRMSNVERVMGGGRTDGGPVNEMDIFYGTTQIADSLDSNPGWNNEITGHRFFEYLPNGSYRTNPAYVGDNIDASIVGVTNDAVTGFDVWASSDGINWTDQLITAGSGVTDFTTPAGKPYVQVRGTMVSTPANLVVAPDVYSYTPSVSPQIDSLMIQTGMDPIKKFNDAINNVSDLRAAMGIEERKLYHVMDELSVEKINLMAANSRIEDADFARNLTEMTREDILINSNVYIAAQGDQISKGVLRLLDDQGIGGTLSELQKNGEK